MDGKLYLYRDRPIKDKFVWYSPGFSLVLASALFPEVKHLISYADTSAGNKGTIYKAANYKLIDEREADFYIMPDGERVHPVTMWHRHGTRAWDFLQAHYPGIRKAEGKQLKFIFNL